MAKEQLIESLSRKEVLEKEGLACWLKEIEKKVLETQGLSDVSQEEGELLKRIFEKAVNWGEINFSPSLPEKKTETPVNQAREEGLKRVFPGISKDIDWLAKRVAGLRRKTPKKIDPLRKGVVEVLADIVWVAWAHSQRPDLAEAARKALSFSLASRLIKGKYREQDLCSSKFQEALIFYIRGLRDLPPESLDLIGKFLENQLEANLIMQKITEAERLRVEGGQDGFDEEKYKNALSLARDPIGLYQQEVEKGNWKNWSSRKIAAVAHHYLMVATIEQSRAKHTLEEKEKVAALVHAAACYKKLKELAEELGNRNYFYTADGSVFIWPVETFRSLARTEERSPGKNNLSKAMQHYQQAMGKSLEIAENNQFSEDIRNLALMTAGTTRVEWVLVRHKISPLQKDEVYSQFRRACEELTKAWDGGYQNVDRFRTSMNRMISFLTQGNYSNDELKSLLRERDKRVKKESKE
ncbi:hypothetical protein J7J95_01395 [bacterium]|nr:hypothetical protein [bacterium]